MDAATTLSNPAATATSDTPTLLDRLLRTDATDRVLLGQRVLLGAVMLPHGAQKLLGWFGGFGFQATMGYFTGTLHIPAPLAFLVVVAESFGALGLVLGLLSRVAAFGVLATMVGAALLTHLPFGFFMNWFGTQKGEGFEYHLLAVALALPVVVLGGGARSLDAWLVRRRGAPGARS
jgi:putative oxidoreductase